jgi:hypothetical protein
MFASIDVTPDANISTAASGQGITQMTQQHSCNLHFDDHGKGLCCMIAQRPAVSMQALAVTPERGYIITASCPGLHM